MTAPPCILVTSRTILLKPMGTQITGDLIKVQILFQEIWGGAWVSNKLLEDAHEAGRWITLCNSKALGYLIPQLHTSLYTLTTESISPYCDYFSTHSLFHYFELPSGITVSLAPKHSAISTSDHRLNFITQCSMYPLPKVM